ncbi:MAG TPA: hypothetical protein VGD51_13650 [Nocardioidaceae bacterium]
MIRSLLSAAALLLLAFLGWFAALVMYDLTSIYGDPTGSALSVFSTFAVVPAVAAALMLGVGAAAVSLAQGRLRRLAIAVATVIGIGTAAGLLVGNHYGLEDKRAETSVAPSCGIQNPALSREFGRIDHPGYFGGGSASRTGCSYRLTAKDLAAAFDAYEAGLVARGYHVQREGRGLTASSGGYRFTATARPAVYGDDALTVTLAQTD